jgi:hypothetical protein
VASLAAPAPPPLRAHVVRGLVLVVAVALLGVTAAIGPAWVMRHLLPEFFHPREQQLAALSIVRLGLAALGLVLVWPVSGAAARWAARRRRREVVVDLLLLGLAIAGALVLSEVLLRRLPWFATHQLPSQREPLRRRDPVMGWAYQEARVGRGALGGRMIDYVFDRDGHRVARPGDAVDYARPTVLFVGESIITGHGLTYPETIPAQVGARLGLQAANLSVGGFATDQMYLRFAPEWPRYRQPRAVVVLFMPSLFHRNLEHDRPHLDPGLVWRPPSDDPRLFQIAHRLVPYRSDADLEAAFAMTHQALARIVADARAKGATPLILVPELEPESGEEAAIRERALAGLPVLRTPIDPTWRLPHNRHPDARAAAKIGAAVADYLRAQGVR